MYYFQHYISQAGLHRLERAAILRTVADDRVYADLGDEIRDVFPQARVDVVPPDDVPAGTDLAVLPVMAPHDFAFHDVVYERMDELAPLRRAAQRAAFVMVYRVLWREVEVLPARRWRARLRKRRLEGALIRLCRRSRWLRRLLRPHYPC